MLLNNIKRIFMSKGIVRRWTKINGVFEEIDAAEKNYNKKRKTRGEAKPIDKIDEKWLVRGNISHNNRNCSITCGEV